MEKTSNRLIQSWQLGANFIVLNTEGKATENLKELAREQLQLLDETKPNKNKTLKEQVNEEQKELIEYLEKVIETGEY